MDSGFGSHFMKAPSSSTDPSSQVQRAKPHFRAGVEKPELTPLTRLAKFKAIRDRNLKRPPLNPKRISGGKLSMDSKANGVSESDPNVLKTKATPHLINGNDTAQTNGSDPKQKKSIESSHTNATEVVTVDDPLVVGKSIEAPSADRGTENESHPPDEQAQRRESSASGSSKKSQEVLNDSVELVADNPVNDFNSDRNEPTEDSDGSSLDVIGDFVSVEELDLKFAPDSSDEEIVNTEPIATESEELLQIAQGSGPEEPFVPDIVRRMNADGQVNIRRTLRSQQLKRKLDEMGPSVKKMRSGADGSTASPGWKFFTPSLSLNKFWTPSANSDVHTSDVSALARVDESMHVNVGDQSNINDKIDNDNTGDSQEQKSSSMKWCNVM